jgi:nucleotide-binding universal stress UspA family protein
MKILVPIDFTSVTENALKYAIGLCDTLPVTGILLYHVVASEKEAPTAAAGLNRLIDTYRAQTRAVLESKVEPGNIFDKIGPAAAAEKAALIVMGTHGIKGMQRLIGSKAMRVITNSETPYIVIQQQPYRKVKKMMIPVDSSREGKQLLPLLEKLNEKFNAELLLVRQTTKDEFIDNKIRNNIMHFKAYLKDCGIQFAETGTFTASSKYKDVVREAAAGRADLIVTTIDPETDITDYIMGVEEQKLVANELQLPVLCVNIRHFMNRKGGIFEIM